jgi:uncharacterized protein with PIN domain
MDAKSEEIQKKVVNAVVEFKKIVVAHGRCPVCNTPYEVMRAEAINHLASGKSIRSACQKCGTELNIQKPLIVASNGMPFIQ